MIDLTDTPLPSPPPRTADSHKGDYGRALIAGGSLGMAGAPALSGMACLRSGTGLVSVLTPRCVQPTVAAFCPAYMTHAAADNGERFDGDALARLVRLANASDAVALGPGLGRWDRVGKFVAVCQAETTRPMVLDADALFGLSRSAGSVGSPGGPRVLTPHAGEFARLCDAPLADPGDDAQRCEAAAALARADATGKTVVLLKGPRTVVTDGERFAVNTTGNPGMATGGSGDVLTGVVTALLAQGLDAFDAARLGAHAHGLAGDLAAAKLGEVGMIASDLIDALPDAWKQLGG